MNKLFVISGPSGSGKGTLVAQLLKDFPDLQLSVSATTRPKRPGEVPGKDYYFLSREEFSRKLKAGEFIEHERVHGNLYGTLKSEVNDKLQKGGVVFELDTKGAFTVKKLYGVKSVLIFITVPSIEALRQRLLKRATDSLEVIEKRVKQAVNEIKQANKFDYVVLNDKMDKAYIELVSIMRKERGLN